MFHVFNLKYNSMVNINCKQHTPGIIIIFLNV